MSNINSYIYFYFQNLDDSASSSSAVLGIERLPVYDNNSTSDEEIDVVSTDLEDRSTCARTIPLVRVPLQTASPVRPRENVRSSSPRRKRKRSASPLDDTEGEGRKNNGTLKKRRNYCPFCEKKKTNFSRHLVTCHPDEDDVKEYVALKDESPRRRKRQRTAITNRLKNVGNKTFNQQIVEGQRNDDFLPVKRSTRNELVSNLTHVTCKRCLGFFKKDTFYKHLARCGEGTGEEEPNKKKKTSVLRTNAQLLVRENEHASSSLKEEVFPTMQMDAETSVVQGDALISKYGSKFRFTHRGTKQIHYCSSRMRTLARLFLTMKDLNSDVKEFRDCIVPKRFNVMVESVRRMSDFNAADGYTKSPSVPPRLCSSLKSCANIVKSEAIQDASLTKERKNEILCEMNEFLFLMEKNWSTEVSSNSEKSRKRMNVMKKDLLPDPDDIITLSTYIHDLCPFYISRLKRLPTVANYEKLAKLILVHIITLNRRRPSETVEIPLASYVSTLNESTDYGNDVQRVITREEINSGRQLSIFYIPANKNLKKVPILLTKKFHEAIEALIEAREKIGITSSYLFGRPGNVELFDGSAVLREMANKANLKKPSNFTANALRHHAATSSQLQPRNDNYTKSLSKFMGHDLRTHEHYYEMPLPLVQKSIVGHRLLNMILPKPSSSTASHTVTSKDIKDDALFFDVNRNAEDGTVVENTTYAERSNGTRSSSEDNENEKSQSVTSATSNAGSCDNNNIIVEETVTNANNNNEPPTQCVERVFVIEVNPDNDSDEPKTSAVPDLTFKDPSNDDDDSTIDRPESLNRTPPKKKHKKVRWTTSEKNTVYEKFGYHFTLDVKPTRKEIKEVWENEPSLKNRSLVQVVTYVNNIATKKQILPSPIKQKITNMVNNNSKTLSP